MDKLTIDIADESAPVVAAIDLGTNSCRLLVAKISKSGFHVVDSFSRVVRLGETIEVSNKLTDDAIDRAVEALKICNNKVKNNNVLRIRAVTTEACRRAHNAIELIKRVQSEIGLDMEVITSEEEARLALSGCSGVLNPRFPYAITFDIGGGSTEVMWLKLKNNKEADGRPGVEVIDWLSMPFGVVTISETYGSHVTSARVYNGIRKKVLGKLREFSDKNNIGELVRKRQVQMVGTSGTVTTLAAIKLDLLIYDRRRIDGIALRFKDIRRISREIREMSPNTRVAHSCIGVGRSELVVAGSAILEGIIDAWNVGRLAVADRGVREGILMDMVRELRTNE